MKIYKGIAQLQSAPQNCVLTIGNFDSVHIGHQALLRNVVEHAARISGTPVAITFRPHPYFILRPNEAPQLLNTYEEKHELIAKYGIQLLVEEPFSREFSNTSPEEFVNELLVGKLGVKVIYLGHDFAFGKGRAGSVQMLEQLTRAQGVALVVLPATKIEGTTISSSLIRKSLDEAKISFVNQCLARPFFLRGIVRRGDGRGSTIGIPTANLQCEIRKFPRTGVYATRTHWRGKRLDSITNIGFNPTFNRESNELPLKIETHIFSFSENIYGDEIQIDFLDFLRTEKKFSGAQELLAQMQKDFSLAKEMQTKL